MLFGRRRAFPLFAPLPDDAPPGGGGGSPDPPPAQQPPPAPPPAPVTGKQPPKPDQPPQPEWMKDPAFLAEMDRRMAAVADRTRAETETKVKADLAEAARLEKLSVEERARTEAAAAKAEAAAAKGAATKATNEASFLRSLLGAGLQPQDEMCEQMALQGARLLAGEGQPITIDILKRLAAEKHYLFKPPDSAPAAPVGGTANPAELQAARTLNTGAPAQPASGGAAAAVVDARDMSRATWDAELARMNVNRPAR